MAAEFKVHYTDKSEEDLDEILNYISVDLSNPIAAMSFLDEFEKTIDRARLFPESGSPVNNPYVKTEGLRKLYVKNYTVFYFPDMINESIVILRIIYSHRDIASIINSL